MFVCCILTFLLAMSSLALTQTQRPHILGLAHVAFRVSDLDKTGAFYENVLGYEEPFSLKDGNGKTATSFVKVNDLQYVELFPGDARNRGQLDHFALYTDDLVATRTYLLAQGMYLFKDVRQGHVGNSFLTIMDPGGYAVEILQYSPNSLTARAQGKFMPTGRISDHISHIGIVVKSVDISIKFYRDVLGFREGARGGGKDGNPGWVDMQTPEGNEYIELISVSATTLPADVRAQNHFCLSSSDVRKTVASLQNHASKGSLTSDITVQTGDGLPPRADLFDPDGTRIEIMKPLPARMPITERPTRDQ
jgi:lactoylglutathione lyase